MAEIWETDSRAIDKRLDTVDDSYSHWMARGLHCQGMDNECTIFNALLSVRTNNGDPTASGIGPSGAAGVNPDELVLPWVPTAVGVWMSSQGRKPRVDGMLCYAACHVDGHNTMVLVDTDDLCHFIGGLVAAPCPHLQVGGGKVDRWFVDNGGTVGNNPRPAILVAVQAELWRRGQGLYLKPGQTIVTPAFGCRNVKALAFTASPIHETARGWRGYPRSSGTSRFEQLLYLCYMDIMEQGLTRGYRTLCMPILSGGHMAGDCHDPSIFNPLARAIVHFIRMHADKATRLERIHVVVNAPSGARMRELVTKVQTAFDVHGSATWATHDNILEQAENCVAACDEAEKSRTELASAGGSSGPSAAAYVRAPVSPSPTPAPWPGPSLEADPRARDRSRRAKNRSHAANDPSFYDHTEDNQQYMRATARAVEHAQKALQRGMTPELGAASIIYARESRGRARQRPQSRPTRAQEHQMRTQHQDFLSWPTGLDLPRLA